MAFQVYMGTYTIIRTFRNHLWTKLADNNMYDNLLTYTSNMIFPSPFYAHANNAKYLP